MMDSALQAFVQKHPDEAAALVNYGTNIGREHSTPSPDTIKMFQEMREDFHGHFVDFRSLITETLAIAKEARDEAKNTNGKVAELKEWKLRTEGGTSVLKGIWGFATIYVVGSSFVLLNMWADWRNQDIHIRSIINNELQTSNLK